MPKTPSHIAFAELPREELVQPPAVSGFRSSLRACVTAAAVPYGYTITIWSTGALSMGLLGTPHLVAVLLFIAGAALGYLALARVASGQIAAGALHQGAGATVPANVHLLSAGTAVIAVWGIDHALQRDLVGWAIAGFLATSLYLTLAALQITIARRQ